MKTRFSCNSGSNAFTVVIRTGGHCVETALKRELTRLETILLSQERIAKSTINRYENIRCLLKSIDFRQLRADFPALDGVEDVEVTLTYYPKTAEITCKIARCQND